MLQRWEPQRGLETAGERMSRLLEEFWAHPELRAGMTMVPATDVIEHDADYEVRVSLPGVQPQDVNVMATGNTLSIRAQRKEEIELPREDYLLRERLPGTFSRSVTFPSPVNANEVNASLEHGVLTVRLPKSAEARPRRVEVQAGGGPRQM